MLFFEGAKALAHQVPEKILEPVLVEIQTKLFEICDVMRRNFSAKFKNETLTLILYAINKPVMVKLAIESIEAFNEAFHAAINSPSFCTNWIMNNSFNKLVIVIVNSFQESTMLERQPFWFH